jgi:hypothetical protein
MVGPRSEDNLSSTRLINVIGAELDAVALGTIEKIKETFKRHVLSPLLPEFHDHLTVVQHGPTNVSSAIIGIINR